jgi:hypothetical protein
MYLLVECTCGRVHVLVIYHMACSWRISQYVNVLFMVLCFLSRGFKAGVYFLALCFRKFSPCVLIDFPGLGAAGLVCSGERVCVELALTSVGGECLPTTGLTFGRLVTMSLSLTLQTNIVLA